MTTFIKPENWASIVYQVNSVEAFQGVARAMFDDGKVTPQRLMVLETFARDVGHAHPDISKEVMRYFNKVWGSSETLYKRLCWTFTKYNYPALFKNVVETLVSVSYI